MNCTRSKAKASTHAARVAKDDQPFGHLVRRVCAGRKLGSAAKKITHRIAICFGGRSRLCLKGAVNTGDGELARAVRLLMRSGYVKPPPPPTREPHTSGRSKLAPGASVLAFARSSSTPRMETTDG